MIRTSQYLVAEPRGCTNVWILFHIFFNKAFALLWRDSIAFVYQKRTELLHISWFTFRNWCLDDAPQISYWTHVRRLCRPIQKLDSMLVHPSLATSGSVTRSIVLFEDLMLSQSAIEKSMWCANFTILRRINRPLTND